MRIITTMDKKNIFFTYAWAALAVAILISTVIGAYTYYSVKSFNNTLSVTGSATTKIMSDQVKWMTMITRNAYQSDLAPGYAALSKDLVAVKAFFKAQGIEESQLVISPVFMEQIYKQNNEGPTEYYLRQTITVSSTDVQKISSLTKDTQSLISQGVVFQTQGLEYSYSKLPELRVSLLADALKDAKARAQTLAETSGARIGELRGASSGVVQVLSPNSTDVSDYGTYDTSSIEKQVMVTIKASFSVK